MPKFTFVTNATISLHLEVEADTVEEAAEKALECSVMGLCYECAGSHHNEWSTSGELDTGTPGTLVELWKDDECLSQGDEDFELAQEIINEW